MATSDTSTAQKVKEIIGCSDRTAQNLLNLTGNNVEAAVAFYRSRVSARKFQANSDSSSVPLRDPIRKDSLKGSVETLTRTQRPLSYSAVPGSNLQNTFQAGGATPYPSTPSPAGEDRRRFSASPYPGQPPATQPPSQSWSSESQSNAVIPPESTVMPPSAKSGNSSVQPVSTGLWLPTPPKDTPTLVLRGEEKQNNADSQRQNKPPVGYTTKKDDELLNQDSTLSSVPGAWEPIIQTRSNSQRSEEPAIFSPTPQDSGKSSGSSIIDVAEEKDKTFEIGRPPSYVFEEEKLQAQQQEEEVPVNRPDLDKIQHWNFLLPRLPAQLVTDLNYLDEEWVFDAYTFACSLQHAVPFDKLKAYLQKCARTANDPNNLQGINTLVGGFPLMFYAVETNNDWLIQELYRYGGDVNAIKDFPDIYSVPLLAFAVVNSINLDKPTTQMVATLLSLGATATVFPQAFYEPLCQDIPANGPREDKLIDLDELEKAWCRPEETRRILTKALDVTSRYYIAKSLIIERPGRRARQVAKRRNAEPLWGVPYMMIGQIWAASMVTDRLISHLMYQDKKPMVLVFAGPSGHGKTELARKLGYLLSLDLEIVDCTTFSDEKDLFGFRKGWQGSKEGSRLNNFLARKNGQQAIVFLDEFEKTTQNVWNALLIPFDNGEYQDRRNDDKIDCSRIIWILATNAIDETIMSFWDGNEKGLLPENPDKQERKKLLKRLSKEIQKEFKGKFKPPITGRITEFIPFLPFSPSEQVVGAHKYILEFTDDVRKPVTINSTVNRVGLSNNDQLLGGIRLCVQKDVALCKHLSEEYYDKDLGIRSLKSSVKDVKKALVKAYLAVDDDITSTDTLTDYVVDIADEDIVAFSR